jgi:hypothetical protein
MIMLTFLLLQNPLIFELESPNKTTLFNKNIFFSRNILSVSNVEPNYTYRDGGANYRLLIKGLAEEQYSVYLSYARHAPLPCISVKSLNALQSSAPASPVNTCVQSKPKTGFVGQ